MPNDDAAAQTGAPRTRVGVVGPHVARPSWQSWLLVFLLSCSLYAATANRGIQWQDSGYRVLRVITHDLLGHLGLALSHPLHYWLARLVTLPHWHNPALVITLLSSLFAAVTVANVFGCVRLLTGNWKAAAFASASLAVAHIFWQMATLAETYTLTAALLSAEIWCLVLFLQGHHRALTGMFLFNGLGLANHMLAGLTTPVLVIVALLAWRDRRITNRDLLLAALVWLAGSLPYSALVAIQCIRTGDLLGTIRTALFGTAYADRVLNTRLSPGLLARSAGFLAYDFPNLLLPAAALGLLRAERLGQSKSIRFTLIAAMIIHALFVMRYNIVDQQTFFIPLCVLLSIWGGLGAAYVLTWPASISRTVLFAAAVALLVLTPATYAIAPHAARRLHLLDKYPQKPYRDSYTYFFVPWSIVEDSADRMSDAALDLTSPDGVVLYSDGMALPALEYKRLRRGASGVRIAAMPSLTQPAGHARFLELIHQRPADAPVILVPGDVRVAPAAPPAGMKWAARGELYELEQAPEHR